MRTEEAGGVTVMEHQGPNEQEGEAPGGCDPLALA